MHPMNMFCVMVCFVFIQTLTTSMRQSTHSKWPTEGCTTEERHMTCVGSLPGVVPRGILQVELQDLDNNHLNRLECVFCHNSWATVEKLSIINGNTYAYITELEEHQFKGLINLTHLVLNLPHLRGQLPTTTFSGLNHVTTLDLSNCQEVSTSNLFKALENPNILPKLSNLILHRMNSMNEGKLSFIPKMIRMLGNGRNITYLDVSNTRVVLSERCYSKLYPLLNSLQFLNMSNTVISRSDDSDKLPCPVAHDHTLRLNTLDISELRTDKEHVMTDDFKFIKNTTFTYTDTTDIRMFSNVQTVYARSLFPIIPGKYISMYNSVITIPIKGRLRHLDLSRSSCKWMDLIVIADGFRLSSLDASYNDMEYLKPALLQQTFVSSLTALNLSNNCLNKMKPDEFENLLRGLTKLERLNLCHNNLSQIPKHMFAQNNNLQVLNLCNNQLSRITFEIELLHALQYLDITGNNFMVLESATIKSFNFMSTMNTRNGLKVNLHNNPLGCSTCQSLEFIKWVCTSQIAYKGEDKYTCEDKNKDSKTVDDEDAVHYIEHICDRNKILRRTILMSTLIPVGSVTILVLTIKHILKTVKKRRVAAYVDRARQQIEINEYEFKYPVFLSYSSQDDDIVLNHMYREFHHQLQVTCRTDRELVCIGDKHFRAGRWIFDEVTRCLEMSGLLVVVMSRNYCQSEWCMAEIQQAYQLQKRMLIVSIEHVDEQDMHPVLREHFRKHVRVQFVQHGDGYYEIIPDWDNVCTSILSLLP